MTMKDVDDITATGSVEEVSTNDNLETKIIRKTEDERICHMMPCSIQYQGMSSTHVYFQPVEAEGVLNSTFRGRGLLAISPSNDEIKCYGVDDSYLSAALVSIQNNQLQVKAEIDRIVEWKHEHNPESLLLEIGGSQVQLAKDWSEVALALHEPITP